MPKPSTRDAMLKEGLRLCQDSGFSGASVRDITRAAGAPLGSFNNHFTSKEAFGREILEIYRAIWRQRFAVTVHDESVPPRDAFERLFAMVREEMQRVEWRSGCLLTHYGVEVSSLSDDFRAKLLDAHAERRAGFTAGLRRCVQVGHLSADVDCEELGEILDDTLQGAMMKVRVGRDPAPFDRFTKYALSTLGG